MPSHISLASQPIVIPQLSYLKVLAHIYTNEDSIKSRSVFRTKVLSDQTKYSII